ncbi:MAG: PmoA family protein [Pirellulales bacterium]
MLKRICTIAAIVLGYTLLPHTHAAEVKVEKSDQGAKVLIGDELFTEYITDSGGKPVLWPVIGPTGKAMTRSYPIGEEQVEGERRDHIHHRSIWFTHGAINGVDFWAESEDHGITKHREFVTLKGGDQGLIITRNDWLDADGKKVMEDERTLVFGADEQHRWIDFQINMIASEENVVFGDTKEGTFGVRVAGTMKADSEPGGHIVNSRGQTDGQAWGKPAEWVDYHGPVEGEHLGVAILNHPSSFRFPTYWHVRTYGLFAANPFGLHDFRGADTPSGEHTLKQGETMTLRYRVILHQGDEKAGRVAEAFDQYRQAAAASP